MSRATDGAPAETPPPTGGPGGLTVHGRAVSGGPGVDATDFRALFEGAPGNYLVLAPDAPRFTMLAASDERLAATLATRAATLGRPLFEVFPDANPANPAPSGVANLRASLDAVLRTRAPHQMPVQRYDLRRPDGTWEPRYWAPRNVPILGPDGAVRYVVHHVEDVTDRVLERAATAAALAAADRLARLHQVSAALASAVSPEALIAAVAREGAPAVGAIVGVVTRLTADGRAFEMVAAYGLPDALAAERGRFPNAPPSPHAEALAARAPLFIETEAEYARRFPNLPPLATNGGARATAALPLVVGGEPFGVLGFGFAAPRAFTRDERDFLVTVASQCAQALERARLFEAERAARRAAEDARHEAEAANRAKAEFLAVMSHELRTPLNAIGGYAELMAMGIRGPVSDQQREDLRRIEASQRHLLGLINEVLNYAKLETGAVHYALAPVCVRDALAAAEALVAPQAQAKGLAIAVGPCPPERRVRADAEKLRQVLVNLLSNAVKFTPPGGRIALACAHDDSADGHVAVRVRDTGIGIAADQRERIFDPFVQVRADLTRTAEGTGLGLAISRDLARGMGGDLTVESTPGVGSTFVLTLPAAT